MSKIIISIVLLSSLLFASNASDSEVEGKKRAEQQLKIEMEKEKKYAKEQTFYSADNYDFKGAEVNKDSLESVPVIEVDDFNIDSVYD